MSNRENFIRESLSQPDQEAELKRAPEHSAETLRMVEQIDGGIANR